MRYQKKCVFNTFIKTALLLLFISLPQQKVFCQNKVAANTSSQIYEERNVDNKPEFQGGGNAVNKFIAANYKMPDVDSYNGQVIINFIVETDGTLSDFNVLKDIGHGTGLEAERVFRKSPKWSPGILDGKPVRVKVSFPITLKSEED